MPGNPPRHTPERPRSHALVTHPTRARESLLLAARLVGTRSALLRGSGTGAARTFRLALRRRRRRSIVARSPVLRRLLGVIGDIPSRTLELHRRSRQQLLQLSATMRTHRKRRVGKFLDPFGKAVTLLALIFVERHDSPQSF